MSSKTLESSTIQQLLDQFDRRILLALSAAIALVLIANLPFKSYWRSYFLTPRTADARALASLLKRKQPPSAPWIISAENLVPTRTEHRNDGYLVRRYYLMPVAGRLLIVGAKDSLPKTGQVPLYWTAVSKFERDTIIPALVEDTGFEAAKYLPIAAESSDAFRDMGTFTLILIVVVLSLCGIGLVRVAPRLGHYRRHPIYKLLTKISESGAEAAWLKLNEEWRRSQDSTALPGGKLESGKIWLLRSFLVWTGSVGFKVVPLDAVIWTYRESVTRQLVVRIHTFVFCLSTGEVIRAGGSVWSTAIFESVFAQLAETRPWIQIGHTDALASEWKKSKAAMIERVVQARARARQRS